MRSTADGEFASLCAAILSVQTRDRLAISATRRLTSRLGCEEGLSPAALVLAPVDVLTQCLQDVNFYKSKVLRLRETAATLLSQHSGRVPASFEALVALPGIGPKIANLVLAVTFQQPDCGMIVDTHVHRVARRLGWSTFTAPRQTQQCLEDFISAEKREIVARQMIGFGQEICKPRPMCNKCPLAQDLCPSALSFLSGPVARPKLWKLRPRKRTIIELGP